MIKVYFTACNVGMLGTHLKAVNGTNDFHDVRGSFLQNNFIFS